MPLSEVILAKISEWTNPPYEEDCINEIKELLSQNNEKELNERFAVELEFGTGGLRGIIRNGTNGMNKYVVARATQGLANYVLASGESDPKAVIAYDSRLYSKEFAIEAATVLASNGIKTYIFSEMRPTPELSYAVRKLGCVTGIVITASHNPKEYNGYKVYWKDGGQIVPPHDENIIREVRKVEKITDVKKSSFESNLKNGMIQWIDSAIDEPYIKEILSLVILPEEIKKSNVKIVFTPLHGTGGTIIPKVLSSLGFSDIIYVQEQMKGDPYFSTVRKPNPEERDALDMGINYAQKHGADIVIATDPDADRMGIAIRDKEGNFKVISGNHIGAIIEYYVLSMKKEKGILPSNGAVVKTIVTTDLQDAIAESFSMKVFNVLTGFKYIGEKIREFEETGDYTYVFGGEESYGYLMGTYARDKDAVAATVAIAECCAYLKNRGKTLVDYLNEIFQKYGYYDDRNVSIDAEGLKGAEVIAEVMRNLRASSPEKISGLKVVKVIDYKNDTVHDAPGSSKALPKSNVIKYVLEDHSTVTVRPSGTEPKIKFYFSARGKDMKETDFRLTSLINGFIPEIKDFISKRINE
ncbi:MAG TPA: phospho-sugar mutase [Spirochaetota bacterium]|nr:phospho-sugar mutase [Spirochaetota bacterium]HRU66428.1 phospho-sugar mutase [Spirochaetota bacterium]